MTLAFMAMAALLVGCVTMKPAEGPDASRAARPSRIPPYDEVAFYYNRNVALLDRLWAKALVQVEYREEDKKKREQGDDSTLMIEVPDRLALSIGKFGISQPLVWAGCDAHRYWLFDLMGDKVVAYGKHANLDRIRLTNLPLKVRPTDIPMLMGLMPLESGQGLKTLPPVEWDRGCFVTVTPDGRSRVWVEPGRFLPRRVELLDSRGRVAVMCDLDSPVQMEMIGVGSGEQPWVSTVADIALPSGEFRMKMTLSRLTDARANNETAKDRAFRRAFDFDFLARTAFHIPPENWINLDVPAPVPGSEPAPERDPLN
ncbi:MAG: hypothetical protein IT440_08425 [Phycisphaeraceae bacterium]|nr:hypothetical protein [Phycisphaeraceae bacterium]